MYLFKLSRELILIILEELDPRSLLNFCKVRVPEMPLNVRLPNISLIGFSIYTWHRFELFCVTISIRACFVRHEGRIFKLSFSARAAGPAPALQERMVVVKLDLGGQAPHSDAHDCWRFREIPLSRQRKFSQRIISVVASDL